MEKSYIFRKALTQVYTFQAKSKQLTRLYSRFIFYEVGEGNHLG